MKTVKFAAGNLLLSSCLILSNFAKPAHALPVTTTKLTTVQTKSTLRNTTIPIVHTPIINTASHIGSIVRTTPLVHTTLVGSASKVTTTTTKSTTTTKTTTTTPTVVVTGQPGTTSVTTVPTSLSQASQQISSVISNDWASWTGGSTKPLTLAEVGQLLSNPKITGSQAAVLGMIADQMNSDISTNPNVSPSYTLAQTTAFILGTSTSASSVFTNSGGLPALQYYTMAMQQIASSTTSTGSFSLYGSYTAPQLAGIQQGAIGDCFYLSAIESVLNQNPTSIANMIKQTSSSTFTVTFANGTKENVSLTDADVASFSLAPNNGSWLAVLGLAENSVLVSLASSTNPQVRSQYAVTLAQKDTPLGIVSDGGYPTQTLNLLTGQSYGVVSASNYRQYYNVTAIDKLLQSDLASNTPIGVESLDHALAILAFNPTTQMVTILNPWGVSGGYGQYDDPGILNPWMNVNMTNGVFTLSTSQMLLDFYSLTAPSSLLNAVFPGAGLGRVGALSSFAPQVANFAPSANLSSPHVLPMNLPQINSSLGSSINASLATATNIAQGTFSNQMITANVNSDLQDANVAQATASGNAEANEVPVSFAPQAHKGHGHGLSVPQISNNPVYEAGQGTMLIMHDTSVQVNTKKASVDVAPHACALIIQIGNQVAVSNLCDSRTGEVALTIGDERIVVPMGHAILIGESNAEDAKDTGLIEILDGQARSLGKYSNASAFEGRLSYLWAIRNCPQFRELIHSSDPSERKAAMKLMRAGAAVMTLAQGHQS